MSCIKLKIISSLLYQVKDLIVILTAPWYLMSISLTPTSLYLSILLQTAIVLSRACTGTSVSFWLVTMIRSCDPPARYHDNMSRSVLFLPFVPQSPCTAAAFAAYSIFLSDLRLCDVYFVACTW